MKNKLSTLIYLMRAVLLVSLISSFLFFGVVTSAVLFVICGVFNFCVNLTSEKYIQSKNTIYSKIDFCLERVMNLFPFLYLAAVGRLAFWIVLILALFEISVSVFKMLGKLSKGKKSVQNVMYALYNISLVISAGLILFEDLLYGARFILLTCVLAGITLVILALLAQDEKGVERIDDENPRGSSLDENIRENQENKIIE